MFPIKKPIQAVPLRGSISMAFCKQKLRRHVSFKLDYGLWEVATIVRKEPLPPFSKLPKRW